MFILKNSVDRFILNERIVLMFSGFFQANKIGSIVSVGGLTYRYYGAFFIMLRMAIFQRKHPIFSW